MDTVADKSVYYSAQPDQAAPDPREPKYQLAQRLIDNIRFGEALRILDTLDDYKNSRALAEQVRALQAYQEAEDARLKEERRRLVERREAREALERRRRRIVYAVLALAAVIAFLALK